MTVVLACMEEIPGGWDQLVRSSDPVYVITNAGGVVTPDVVESIIASQRRNGARAVFVIHHTDCAVRAPGPEAESLAGIGAARASVVSAVTELLAVDRLVLEVSGAVYIDDEKRLVPVPARNDEPRSSLRLVR